jgi:hypothetical protein
MCPALLIYKGFSQVMVYRLRHTTYPRGRDNELALVREKDICTRGRVVYALMDLWEEVRMIGPLPLVSARMAVTDVATPSKAEHAGSFGPEVVPNPWEKLARIMHVGLQEEGLVRE